MSLHREDQLAEKMEALFAALETKREPLAAAQVASEDAALAEELVELAETLQPDMAFAETLERALRERAEDLSKTTREINGAGKPNRFLRPPMHGRALARRWRTWAVAASLALALLLLV